VGHSFGGWTALATPEVDRRIRAVVALAPGGSSQPKTGILRLPLTFAWNRDVPTLYLVAEADIMTPLAGMFELFERTPAPKEMVILRRADHMYFVDNIEEEHEAVRRMPFAGDLAWIPQEMRPAAELHPGAPANLLVRGLTLCHFDRALARRAEAQQFWANDVEAELAKRGLEGIVHKP
jgi:dienelactone hydrolase